MKSLFVQANRRLEHEGKILEFVKKGDINEVIKLLNENSSLVNHLDGKSGNSPLFEACSCGHFSIVKVLISKGADITHQNRRKETCLHVAFSKSDRAMIDYFMDIPEARPLLDVPDSDGRTPAMLSNSRRLPEWAEVKMRHKNAFHRRRMSGFGEKKLGEVQAL
eukprot:g4779.t1